MHCWRLFFILLSSGVAIILLLCLKDCVFHEKWVRWRSAGVWYPSVLWHYHSRLKTGCKSSFSGSELLTETAAVLVLIQLFSWASLFFLFLLKIQNKTKTSSSTQGLVNQQHDWSSQQTCLAVLLPVCPCLQLWEQLQGRADKEAFKRGTAQCGSDRTVVKVDLAGMQWQVWTWTSALRRKESVVRQPDAIYISTPKSDCF